MSYGGQDSVSNLLNDGSKIPPTEYCDKFDDKTAIYRLNGSIQYR